MSFVRHKLYLVSVVLLLLVTACAAPAAPAPAQEAAPTEAAAAEEAAEEATEEPAEEEAAEEPAAEEATTEEATAEPAEEEAAAAEGDLPVVGFMKIVSHPALDAEQQGVKDALAEAGYIEGETVIFVEGNAEGDIATLTTIAQRFVDEGVDLIVATSTPALQAAFNATQDFEAPPIVFNAVTSPYAAGIAAAPDDHPSWVIGIQALGPIAEALGLIPAMMPDVTTVGYLYNPAEANSVVNTEIAEPAAEELGLTFEIATISNSSEVQTAAEALVARGVEAFFVSTDSTVVSGLEALVKVANDNDIPFFANDPDSAARGAAVALGLDYYQDGLDTGALAVGILNGELDIAATPITEQTAGSLAVNLTAASEQGLEIPQEYLDQAAEVFE
jgi:putative ABC transport system substrate-binding protein